MSKSIAQKVKQISYLRNFKCVGEACVDNCCIGWIIGVTAENKKFYEEKNSEIVKDLEEYKDGFQVRRCKDGSCSQLENNLCKVQKNSGLEYLPDICYNFPRTHKKIAGDIYMSANMACPETLRLALFSKDSSDFWQWNLIEQSRSKNNLYNNEITNINDFEGQKIENIFSSIVKMIEDPSLNSDLALAKLLILAVNIDHDNQFNWLNISEEISKIQTSEIKEISEKYFATIDMRKELTTILRAIFDLMITYNGRYEKLMDVIQEVLGDHSYDEDKLIANFEPIFEWWGNSKGKFDNLLKNLINAALSYSGFLLTSNSRRFTAKQIALEYLTIKLALMCLSFKLKRDLTEFEIIEAVQPFTKRFYCLKYDKLKEFFDQELAWKNSYKTLAVVMNFA